MLLRTKGYHLERLKTSTDERKELVLLITRNGLNDKAKEPVLAVDQIGFIFSAVIAASDRKSVV